MSDNQNVYAVTRIRVKENALLTDAFMQQLAQADSFDACLNLLQDKGWAVDDSRDPAELLDREREKTWDLMREILKDEIHRLDVFLYSNDYHNLKSAIKERLLKHEYNGIYIDQGTLPAETIRKAITEKKYELLPEQMREPAEHALDVFLRTGDGQLCDILIDRAALTAIYDAGQHSGSEFLKLYAETTVASADIKVALRAMRTGKDRAFLSQALAPCATLDVDALAQAASGGEEALSAYLERTVYADGLEELHRSMSQFERWCDNLLVKRMKPQKSNPFGIDPIAAYVLARDNEIKSVRIILSGKLNGLPDASIEERIREMYA